jgi:hypothetical protein
MKRLHLYIIAGLILYSVGVTLFSVDRSEYANAKELEAKRKDRDLLNRDGVIRDLQDSLAKQDLAALQVIQSEKMRADRAEAKLSQAINRHENTRIIRTTSDRQRDSLIRVVLSQ